MLAYSLSHQFSISFILLHSFTSTHMRFIYNVFPIYPSQNEMLRNNKMFQQNSLNFLCVLQITHEITSERCRLSFVLLAYYSNWSECSPTSTTHKNNVFATFSSRIASVSKQSECKHRATTSKRSTFSRLKSHFVFSISLRLSVA